MRKKKDQHIPRKTPQKSPMEGKTAVGKLDVSLHGTGFVIVEGHQQDIMVRPERLMDGIDGDKVRVKIVKVASNGRTEGEIVEVLEHVQTEFIGKLKVSENFAFLIPDKKNMRLDIYIPINKLKGGKTDDRAIVRIVEWHNAASKNPEGIVTEILSAERENDIAMKEILIEKGFSLHFSKEALKESEKLPQTLPEEEIAKRKDCRDILTLTIDPADARDFDDALSLRKLKNGNYEVGVHIADVSYYVKPNSELDKEAYQRATSVYFPDRVTPMLPEHISNNLCSLRPDEDKFTFSAIFQLDKKGTVKQYWIGRTVIRSKKRLAYEDAQKIIETKEGELSEEILLLHEIAQNLRAERFKKGAINFSSQEVRFQLDETGKPIGVIIKESKEANQLIEEFMLLANRTVATFVSKKEINRQTVPFPYRVHDLPNEEKLKVFAAFASRFGYKFNLNNPDQIAHSFNEMLRLVEGKPEQHVLEQLGIRTMSKAVYSTENIGHYGLGFENYCHFTSPIRRYPDVMVHRIVQECLDDKIKMDKTMEQKARHCSDQERKAMEAERTANKYKQVEYMQDFVGEDFDAVISGISTIGFWAEIISTKCEGLVSIADLADLDEFSFSESDYALIGAHHGKKFRMGDKVRVKVAATNLDKLQIDLDFVDTEEEKATKKSPSKVKAQAGKKGKGASVSAKSVTAKKKTVSPKKKDA